MNREDHMTLYAISVIANSSLNSLQHFSQIQKSQHVPGAHKLNKKELKKLELKKTEYEIEAYDNLNLILDGKSKPIVAKANEIMTRQHGQMAKDQDAVNGTVDVDVEPLMEKSEPKKLENETSES